MTAAPVTSPLVWPRLRLLSEGCAAEGKGTDGGKCEEFEFHMLCMMTDRVRGRLQDISECRSATGKFVTATRADLSFPLVWQPFG